MKRWLPALSILLLLPAPSPAEPLAADVYEISGTFTGASPTIPASVPAGDIVLFKFIVPEGVDFIEVQMVCCGVGNVAEIFSAFVVSDGGIEPTDVVILPDEIFPGFVIDRFAQFHLPPYVPDTPTATLAIAVAEGILEDEVNPLMMYRFPPASPLWGAAIPSPVPEPSRTLLLAAGIATLAVLHRRARWRGGALGCGSGRERSA